MYTATIGLEVHAELKTKSKMFCGCKNDPHHGEPNTNICPICTGQPGTLPVPNQGAIKNVLMFGKAVGAKLSDFTEFDRKNYFYPDIPKAYQISQYVFPLVEGGELAGVALTRVHLEEDTARSQHDKGDYSLVDFNRAGVPLMELVTEPVINSAKEAGNFARELQLLLRTLGISDANMEKGEMRVEANISVSDSEQLGTKVEVKNLNSFKSVEQAILFEIDRHTKVLESGGVLDQETRGWDEQKQVTFVQRKKETAKDYRYFPDPDIPKIVTSEVESFSKSRLDEEMPELPAEKRLKYNNLGLTREQTEQLIATGWLYLYFDSVTAVEGFHNSHAPLVVNYLLTDFLPAVDNVVENDTYMPASEFYFLVTQAANKKLTSRVVKDMIKEFASDPTVALMEVLNTRKLFNDLSEDDLKLIIDGVIMAHPDPVSEYKNGKVAILQFLVGQVMKETKGKADPEQVTTLFAKKLE
ncbi:MAG: Asp-tRNA(Asn)/Glu-tRNA(Gln) amidotransferase subunit GatB [Candidatus Paceibacteria bacterium]